jgi:hypothetical protein
MSQKLADPSTLAEVVQQLEALRDLMTTLDEDVRRFRVAADGPERRALVRSVFACIEGTTFGFRSVALYLARMRNIPLTVGEIAMAREVTYALNTKGQVEERHVFIPILANLRFALTLLAKVAGAPYEFPADDSNFEQLQKAQRVRNRLTHPRSSSDLEVSGEEQSLVIKAGEWVSEQQSKLLTAFVFRLHTGLESFARDIKALPRTETGGYPLISVETALTALAEGLTNSKPISFEQVEAWLSEIVNGRDSGNAKS